MPKLRSKLISEEVEDGVSNEKTCVFEGWWEQSNGLAEKFTQTTTQLHSSHILEK